MTRSALKLADPGVKTVNLNPQRLSIQVINTDLHSHDIDLPLHHLHCSHKVCNGQGQRLRRGSIRCQCCQGQIDQIDVTQPIKVSCGKALSGENIYLLSPELSTCIPENSPCVVV